ncbi:MAG: tyrosine-type recombinase/integrase, partial [Natronomonas sp.]
MEEHINRRISRLRERIETSTTITEADRDALLGFSDELRFKQSDYSNHRHLKLLQHCAVLAGESQQYDPEEMPDYQLVDCLESEDAVRAFVRWIHRHYENETNRDYRAAIRMFGEHITAGEGKPGPIDEISATLPNSYNPMPDPNKMYRWEEHILPMIEAANLPRDKALIAMAWDSGGRSGEIRGLMIGNIGDHEHGLSVTLDGKTGQRNVVLIPSVPYVRQWLSQHPRRNEPDAPLWCNMKTGEDVSYQMKLKILKRAARNADMTPPGEATFTRMRKSSASYLAAQNVSQTHLENHHGWKRGSDVASRYIAVFSQETDREIARAHGRDVTA